MSLSAVITVLNLLEFYDQIGMNVTWSLVAHLLEDKFSALREAWLHFNLLSLSISLQRLGVVNHNLPREVDLLDSTVVELFKSALNGYDDINGLVRFSLVESTLAIGKDALLHIASLVVTVLKDEICALQILFIVALWLHSHEVTASDFLYKTNHK